MKKIRSLCLFLAAIAVIVCLIPAANAVTAADQSVISGCHSVDAAQQLSDGGKLAETAKAVIVYERNSDTMIYTWNPDQRIYPTSMVKLMTALIAIEKGNLDDKVIVTKRALSYVAIGSVSAGLVAGEELTLRDLLYCMMAASANDASTVIAEHIAGSQEAFIAMMNQRAAELGCKDTNFTNAHGLHDENTYTTARDICRITDYALDNEIFKTLFCAKSYTVPATNKSEERIVHTSNYMMSTDVNKKYFDQRVTGGKTGATDEGGRCLVATAEDGGMELLTIVMGAQPTYEDDGLALKAFGSFEETAALLDHTLSNFEYRQIFYTGQVISQYPVSGGENNVVVQPSKDAATVLPKDIDESQLNWIYGESVGTLIAPVEQGQVISVLQVWYGSKCLAQTELTAINAVDVWTEPTQPVRQGSTETGFSWAVVGIVLGILAAIAILIALALVLVRLIRKAKRNALRRNRRQNRRRGS